MKDRLSSVLCLSIDQPDCYLSKKELPSGIMTKAMARIEVDF